MVFTLWDMPTYYKFLHNLNIDFYKFNFTFNIENVVFNFIKPSYRAC